MDIVERLRLSERILNTDRIDAAKEIERLRKRIWYQEHRDGRISTHDPACYAYGPSHYECALWEIERLQEALVDIANIVNPYEDGETMQEIARAALKEVK